jgi:hypothetical protein
VRKSLWIWAVLVLCLTGCGSILPASYNQSVPPTSVANFTPEPTQKPSPTLTPTPSLLTLYFDPAVPTHLRKPEYFPKNVKIVTSVSEAALTLKPVSAGGKVRWVYALVTPFPTVTDEVSLEDLKNTWQGKPGGPFVGRPLLVSSATRAAFESLWGPSSQSIVSVDSPEVLLEKSWSERPSWAIVPFEELEPRWKVLRVEHQSPIDKNMDPSQYPLTVTFEITGEPWALSAMQQSSASSSLLPASNRDPNHMTALLMTGVTALVRATGAKMEANGMTYPAEDIISWFRDADLRHISHEVSFSPHCPNANPFQTTLQFCSRPEYIQLLDYIGTNIVELTGNHVMDWNADSFEYTLQLYHDRGWITYGGGLNQAEARQPVTIEDHGNKIAFIGCNPAGPLIAWAGEKTPGSAACELEWMHSEIGRLRAEGYLVITTFQYYEYYSPEARPWQKLDFEGMLEAGAVIASGSQAHAPQGFGFYQGNFVHYGLGNLFFDQMDIPVVGTRREFLDRHIIYEGRYISTELLTAMLEDYARPRPMTAEERKALLQDMFKASGW